MSPVVASNLALARRSSDCPCCGRNLDGLADRAVFCPSCGKRLREKVTMLKRLLINGSAAVHRVSGGRFGNPIDSPTVPVDFNIGHPPILIGYGNALFALGWRYERRGGAARNLPEAIRCYRKSARLGNLDAMVRLVPGEAIPPVRVIPLES